MVEANSDVLKSKSVQGMTYGMSCDGYTEHESHGDIIKKDLSPVISKSESLPSCLMKP